MFTTLLGWGNTALGFLGGIKVWLIIGGIVSAVVLFLWMENSRLAAQRDKARIEAADAKIAIEAIRADNHLAASIVKARDAKISELEGKTRDLVAKIRALPATKACATSAPVRALLDGMRNGTGETY